MCGMANKTYNFISKEQSIQIHFYWRLSFHSQALNFFFMFVKQINKLAV